MCGKQVSRVMRQWSHVSCVLFSPNATLLGMFNSLEICMSYVQLKYEQPNPVQVTRQSCVVDQHQIDG